jgi:hypothetical protein
MRVYQEWLETNDEETYTLTRIEVNWKLKSLYTVDLSTTTTIWFIYKNNSEE